MCGQWFVLGRASMESRAVFAKISGVQEESPIVNLLYLLNTPLFHWVCGVTLSIWGGKQIFYSRILFLHLFLTPMSLQNTQLHNISTTSSHFLITSWPFAQFYNQILHFGMVGKSCKTWAFLDSTSVLQSVVVLFIYFPVPPPLCFCVQTQSAMFWFLFM